MKKPKITRTIWAIAAALAAVFWLRCGPLPPGLLDEGEDVSTTVVDRHGIPLYEARSKDGTRVVRLAPDALPANVVSATIAAEDRRFFSHVGVDPIAITRAMMQNAKAGRVVEGGSTITQQVVKLLLARDRLKSQRPEDPSRPSGRDIGTKLREAILALRLEHRLSKSEILALYLSLAPYGNQIVGVERASRAYFGSSADHLTVAQAAFLAGLPQRPSAFNPYRELRPALARHNQVIKRMASLDRITAATAKESLAEHLVLTRDESSFVAPHFVEMVLASFETVRLQADTTTVGRPSRIETTLDVELQRKVEGIISSQRAILNRHRAHNVAVVVLHNATGEWLAWEGSGNYFDAENGGAINGALALRQPGSALKPFTYALAFEERETPASVLPDVPSHFPTAEEGIAYSPRNYDGQYRGPLLIRKALAGSQNVPAVALTSTIGVPKLVRFLRAAGFSTFEKTASHYGLGVTLGNAEVRLAELTAAYSTFAREGLHVEPTSVRAVHRGHGREPVPHDLAATRFMSPRTAFWITDILADPAAREYVFGRGSSLDFPFPVAVKTGTSEGYRDNWTIGYTREVTVGVWVGNFDRAPLANSSGVTGAGPIFHAVMLAAQLRVAGHLLQPDAPLATPPANVVRQQVCALSGLPANPWCPSRVAEWLPRAHPSVPCSWHHHSEEGLVTIWPPAYRQWAADQGVVTKVRSLAAAASEKADRAKHQTRQEPRGSSNGTFAIVNPPEGAIYLIDPTLRREYQTLPLRALADRESDEIEWMVDERLLGKSNPEKPLVWSLVPGEHRITARDARGRVDEIRILVK